MINVTDPTNPDKPQTTPPVSGDSSPQTPPINVTSPNISSTSSNQPSVTNQTPVVKPHALSETLKAKINPQVNQPPVSTQTTQSKSTASVPPVIPANTATVPPAPKTPSAILNTTTADTPPPPMPPKNQSTTTATGGDNPNTPKTKPKKSKLKFMMAGLVALVLVAGISTAYYLSQKTQDVRQQASEAGTSKIHLVFHYRDGQDGQYTTVKQEDFDGCNTTEVKTGFNISLAKFKPTGGGDYSSATKKFLCVNDKAQTVVESNLGQAADWKIKIDTNMQQYSDCSWKYRADWTSSAVDLQGGCSQEITLTNVSTINQHVVDIYLTAKETTPPSGNKTVSCDSYQVYKKTNNQWTLLEKEGNNYVANDGDILKFVPHPVPPTQNDWGYGMRYTYKKDALDNYDYDEEQTKDPTKTSIWCGRLNIIKPYSLPDDPCDNITAKYAFSNANDGHRLFFKANLRTGVPNGDTTDLYWCRTDKDGHNQWVKNPAGTSNTIRGAEARPPEFATDGCQATRCQGEVIIKPPADGDTTQCYKADDGCTSFNVNNCQVTRPYLTLAECLQTEGLTIGYVKNDRTKYVTAKLDADKDYYAEPNNQGQFVVPLYVYKTANLTGTSNPLVQMSVQTYYCKDTKTSGECADEEEKRGQYISFNTNDFNSNDHKATKNVVMPVNQRCGSMQVDAFVNRILGSEVERPSTPPGNITYSVCNNTSPGASQHCLKVCDDATKCVTESVVENWAASCPTASYSCNNLIVQPKNPKKGDKIELTCDGTVGSQFTFKVKKPNDVGFTIISNPNPTNNKIYYTIPNITGDYQFRCEVTQPTNN